jgi:molybdopterin-containing oxidoreductase family membrane subunit
MYYPTFWDWALLLGTFGLFSTLFFVFARFVPLVPMHEMRKLIKEKEGEIP